MFDKFIISFFYFFLFSRFFSEKLKILPKWIDLINFVLFFILLALLIFSLSKKKSNKDGEGRYVTIVFLIFTVSFVISSLFNSNQTVFEGSALFYLGFMEGPLLFIALNKLSKNTDYMLKNLNVLYLFVLIVNLILIVFLDIPEFILTGNPDLISGTYGNNTYQFSMLLLICGGYLLGYNYVKKYRTIIAILSQIVILLVFYLSQFRAALPFFFTAYIVMLGFLYGKSLILKILPIILFLLLLSSLVYNLIRSEEKIAELRFEDWVEIASEPQKFLDIGKFKMYSIIPTMWAEYPQTFLIGTGPGNFLSRANYTFSYELLRTDKGVALVVKDFFGISNPFFSDMHNQFVRNKIQTGVIFGSFQLNNPQSSYLAPISEIGVIGGFSIIILYLIMIKKSIEYFKIIKLKNRNFIPIGVAMLGASIYIFSLAFLENYWEMARVTLPVWLLFWAVKTAATNDIIDE